MRQLPPPLPASASQLVAHHLARTPDDLPKRRGVTYIWAGNGLFKHAWNGKTRVMTQACRVMTPGLADLRPFVSWRGWAAPLPAGLLNAALDDALNRYKPEAPEERQWFIALRAGVPVLITPEQKAGAARLSYEMPKDQVLCDIHSHHGLPPFFSGTDDQDDSWLGLSVVVGRLGSPYPSAVARLNCYGDHTALHLGDVFAGELRAGPLPLQEERKIGGYEEAPWVWKNDAALDDLGLGFEELAAEGRLTFDKQVAIRGTHEEDLTDDAATPTGL